MAGSCGADQTANDVFDSLLEGKDFNLPDVDLSDPKFEIPNFEDDLTKITQLTIDDLTTRAVDGNGAFDAIMTSIGAHAKNEYNAGRITGNEYTKTYIGLVSAALGTSLQFLLGKDQSYWQGKLAQQQARAAEIEVTKQKIILETAKAQLKLSVYQALNAESEYALNKLRLATEDAQYCILKSQKEQLDYTIANILPSQKEGLLLDNATKSFTNSTLLPKQSLLLQEQIEVQRSQTLDTRTDGTVISGQSGAQKNLYNQQIISYKRDSEIKAAKMFSDAWITQKTIDEGILPPTNFTNATLDVVLAKIRTNNELT